MRQEYIQTFGLGTLKNWELEHLREFCLCFVFGLVLLFLLFLFFHFFFHFFIILLGLGLGRVSPEFETKRLRHIYAIYL